MVSIECIDSQVGRELQIHRYELQVRQNIHGAAPEGIHGIAYRRAVSQITRITCSGPVPQGTRSPGQGDGYPGREGTFVPSGIALDGRTVQS